MTIGPGGDLYVTDEDAVRRITPTGVVTTIARVAAPDPHARKPFSFGALFGLAVAPARTIYVADFRNRRVLRIAASGAVSVPLRPEPPWTPTGVAVDRNGDIYVMEIGFRAPSTCRPRVLAAASGGDAVRLGRKEGLQPRERRTARRPLLAGVRPQPGCAVCKAQKT
jgi:DNA-binding beta-propeller fold protein YncE